MSETIESNNIRGHIVSEIQIEIEPIVAQKLKPLLENSESLIKNVKETYDDQLKVLRDELHCKNKFINAPLEIIEKFGKDKRNTQPVSLINFENDLTTSSNKLDSKIDPKSDEQQQSHDNKQKISSKELSENSREKGGTNSNLVSDSVTVPKQGHKQQSQDGKEKSRSKNYAKTAIFFTSITANALFIFVILNIGNNLGDNISNPQLIQFSVQSKGIKITEAFSELRK